MKHLFNFTHIVTVAFFAAACVFGFSACNDEVAEQEKITQDVKQELQQEIKDLNDSIDALELGVALKKKFGIKFSSESADNKEHFASVNALADYITAERAKTQS